MSRARFQPPHQPTGQPTGGSGHASSRGRRPVRAASPQAQFGELAAALLYCPKCGTATPVREQLLLVLPDGNLYDYRCSVCGTSTGTKTASG